MNSGYELTIKEDSNQEQIYTKDYLFMKIEYGGSGQTLFSAHLRNSIFIYKLQDS